MPSLINHIPSPQCGHKKTKASSDQATENHQSQVLLTRACFDQTRSLTETSPLSGKTVTSHFVKRGGMIHWHVALQLFTKTLPTPWHPVHPDLIMGYITSPPELLSLTNSKQKLILGKLNLLNAGDYNGGEKTLKKTKSRSCPIVSMTPVVLNWCEACEHTQDCGQK